MATVRPCPTCGSPDWKLAYTIRSGVMQFVLDSGGGVADRARALEGDLTGASCLRSGHEANQSLLDEFQAITPRSALREIPGLT